MAIFGGIGASVVVHGQSLVEYNEDVNENYDTPRENNHIVKYIEATSGAHFEVKAAWDFLDLKGCDGLRLQVDLDGQCMETALCQFKYNDRSTYLDCARRCVGGRWTQEKFRFAEIVSGIDH